MRAEGPTWANRVAEERADSFQQEAQVQTDKLQTLTIHRSKWARKSPGVDNGTSCLLNVAGGMCCLGFVGKALGLGDMALYQKATPRTVGTFPAPWTTVSGRNSQLTIDAVGINDNWDTTDAYKEAALVKLFAGAGIVLTFED